MPGEPLVRRPFGGQRGKLALLSGAVIIFTTCLLLSVSKIVVQGDSTLDADPRLERAFMADYEMRRLRQSFEAYAAGDLEGDSETLALRVQRAQRTLRQFAAEAGPEDARQQIPELAENFMILAPQLLALVPGEQGRYADLAAGLDETTASLSRIVTNAEAAILDNAEREAKKRQLYWDEALYLFGMLASGAVFIGMLLLESRRTRRLLDEATAAQVRIEHLAHHDPLTDLPNRWLFKDRLDQAMRLAQRQGTPVAMHCIDVDFFKTVNDRYGHVTGDQLLVAVAHRMQACLRESDTLARLGGDEFAIIQTGPTALAAEPLAERLLKAFRVPLTADGHKLKATLSIGIGLYPEHATTAEALHRVADTALYCAKSAGRDQYHVWQPGDDRAGFPVRYRAVAG